MAKANEKKADAKVKSPKTGEETKRQILTGTVSGFMEHFAGFGRIAKGTYATYRKMRANPTVALARAVATSPIRTATWSVVADDGVSEDYKTFIEEQAKKFWPEFIRQLLYSLDYGWMPFEKVWDVDREGRFVYRKLKPLYVDKTRIRIDIKTGAFAGVKNQAALLDPNKCFVFTYDGEAGDFYGRSRHENIRTTAYNEWIAISERRGKYFRKIAGILPMVEYPIGRSKNKDGVEKENYELAETLLTHLGEGNGVAMPNTLSQWAGDLARSGVDISQLKAWHISFLETKGTHAKGFTDTLRHLESQIMRGWLVPERAATEGQYGTKAESQTQGEIALVIADLLFEDIIRAVNWYIINPLLVYNFGAEVEDTVRLEPAGLDPLVREFFRKIVEKVLTAPANVGMFQDLVDVEALLEDVGLPKGEQTAPRAEPPAPEERGTEAAEKMARDIVANTLTSIHNG